MATLLHNLGLAHEIIRTAQSIYQGVRMQSQGTKQAASARSTDPTRDSHTTKDNYKTHAAITIGVEPREVYTFWRDFENLPSFLKDVQEIRVESRERSHWVARLKSGVTAEWDARVTADVPSERIAWQSEPGATVETHGEIMFEAASSGEGTVVRLAMSYHVPGGKLTEIIAFFSGEDPDTLALTNLKRLKALLETGEYPTVEGQTSGRSEDLETTKH